MPLKSVAFILKTKGNVRPLDYDDGGPLLPWFGMQFIMLTVEGFQV